MKMRAFFYACFLALRVARLQQDHRAEDARDDVKRDDGYSGRTVALSSIYRVYLLRCDPKIVGVIIA
ncbi:hypothetical protein [Lelliottia sp. CFBP8978]|uniref:hypothetical protein n=1 Tax=Lelliottia sp. CFBP8978 TaxID=3096522 RepID=UPI002A69FC19|nr:hypothetical protein [Lelliottia sp. CFBP8978]MDY1038384.1 hypothetical protein [Lelliottia sp. CFBP8978]